jgi:hypothetical protein
MMQQSCGHCPHSSEPLHEPSPQKGHVPQSDEHQEQSSPPKKSQNPSPQQGSMSLGLQTPAPSHVSAAEQNP